MVRPGPRKERGHEMTGPKEAAPKWAEAVVDAFVPGTIWDDPWPRLITPFQRWLRDKEEWEE